MTNYKRISYKNCWKPNSENKEFWEEVLVGQTITKLEFDKKGLNNFTLSSGEKIFLVKGPESQATICIYHGD